MAKSTHTAYLIAGEKAEEDNVGQVNKIERTYRVIEPFASAITVPLSAAGLPATGEAHPAFSGLKVVSRSPEMQADGITWLITVSYEPQIGTTTTEQTTKTTRLEYGTHALQEDVLINIGTGLPLLDANGKPFEGTVQESVEYPYIKIVKQQKSLSRVTLMDRSGSINFDAITVAGVSIRRHAGRLKITATETTDKLFPWEVTYEVTVREHIIRNFVDFDGNLNEDPLDVGWDIGIVNRGYYYYVASSTGTGVNRATENILDVNGNVIERKPTASPVNLALDGQLLDEGVDPILIRVQTIKARNWSTLGLNTI